MSGCCFFVVDDFNTPTSAFLLISSLALTFFAIHPHFSTIHHVSVITFVTSVAHGEADAEFVVPTMLAAGFDAVTLVEVCVARVLLFLFLSLVLWFFPSFGSVCFFFCRCRPLSCSALMPSQWWRCASCKVLFVPFCLSFLFVFCLSLVVVAV
jgi:hypothetical protein